MVEETAYTECAGKRCVLVIDDDRDIREMISQVLTIEGYHVESAANGQEALTKMRAVCAHPCLVLLDLMMPVMNGWELRSEMERDPALASIPVVVISGDGTTERKAAAVGAVGSITKPIELDMLLATVNRFCPAEHKS